MHWQKFVVKEHDEEKSLWIVIHGDVFDVTNFYEHPGRHEPFAKFAGLDATEAFEAMQHSYQEKRDFGGAQIVENLHLPREGNILKPPWLVQREAVPAITKWTFSLLLLNVNRHLCYHDFW